MRRLLQIISIPALMSLALGVQAQSSISEYNLIEDEPTNSRKKATTRHADDEVPDIRRDISPTSISLYPNPVIDKLMVGVDTNKWQGGTIIIKNRTGKVVAQQRVKGKSTGFNLGSIRRGVYFLTVRKGGAEKTVELIKM